jgi:hypothetical protein
MKTMMNVIVTTVLEISIHLQLGCQFAISNVKVFLQHMLKDPMIATVIQVMKHLVFLVMAQNSIVQHFVIHILQP